MDPKSTRTVRVTYEHVGRPAPRIVVDDRERDPGDEDDGPTLGERFMARTASMVRRERP